MLGFVASCFAPAAGASLVAGKSAIFVATGAALTGAASAVRVLFCGLPPDFAGLAVVCAAGFKLAAGLRAGGRAALASPAAALLLEAAVFGADLDAGFTADLSSGLAAFAGARAADLPALDADGLDAAAGLDADALPRPDVALTPDFAPA